ncbi:four helix bundle protein [Algoriphagus terrigena]|uniref:four helix bundle protein n=1 Tax=Algoriphagus terrigena TaxID=344884 RepID=UPI0003FF231D|nr:four helix bundle protein [Algoriphagus terrigena]
MDFAKLLAYQKGFRLAMEVFQISKSFPKEEKYALTDQIRRSSRSVCACLTESYRKRNNPAHFISKLSDSDMENSETQVWLDFALACEYLDNSAHERLVLEVQGVGKLINFMMLHHEKFGSRKMQNLLPTESS